MSALTVETWVPISVILASLAGSGHCVAMCGTLIASCGQKRSQWVRYQLGRGGAYVVLGALAGALGERLLGSHASAWAAWGASLAMAAGLIAIGAMSWGGGAPHFRWVPQRTLAWFYRRAKDAPLALGALSAALPCGWLQSFVLASAATQSPVRGACLMALFWTGTLPALSAAPWIVSHLLAPARARSPRLTALLLIVAGVAGIGMKMSTLWAASPGGHSHCHEETQRP